MSHWEEYKKSLGETRPWDLLSSSEYTSDEIAADRFAICQSCPEFVKITKQCKKCGCFMKLKTKLTHSTCPIGKW